MSVKRYSLFIIVSTGLFFILMAGSGIASAPERETELFNRGYEYLFSYKPEKAAETFRLFLKEFPESSARDAAMFWLGKTLISMRLYSEAELIFQTIQKEFPDSPFIVFIDVEREEIARIRSVDISRKAQEPSEPLKNIPPKEEKDDKKLGDADKRLSRMQAEKEKAESLLEEEHRANRERMLRITGLEAGDARQKKQIAELEAQVQRQTDLEKSLKESKDERDRLSSQVARLSAEKNTSLQQTPEQKSVVESGESLRFRLAQLELLSEDQGKELTKAREEQEKLKKLLQEEKKSAAELRVELARAKEKEKVDKTSLTEKDAERLSAELNASKKQAAELQTDNEGLRSRIEEMEFQAEQRVRDMRILNTHLSMLMRQVKESPKLQIDPKISEERDALKTALEAEEKRSAELRGQLANLKEQPKDSAPALIDTQSASRPIADTSVMVGNRLYSLAQVIEHQTDAFLLLRRLGAKVPAWRDGDPLNDFITEELLLQEAKRAQITIDAKKYKEMIASHKLNAAEAVYLEKFMTIARYIDTQYAESPPERWIELITVDYKPGDAAAKTVVATDLQKAARGGTSFEEIGKMHPEGVKFSRLSIEEFGAKYKERSQIIQKLNFLREEAVVIWSDKGYMLIKPVTGRISFNPFEEMSPEKKEKFKTFLKQWLALRRK
ncbi:MAG: tetratricopeptide repeat protein [Nitrospirae bacterium]|nr:tetratricopeptide repeat protein [Nitrospirota bacterium]